MSKSYNTEVSEFCLEARFQDFVIKDGYKLKGLLLATPEGECYVKLAKHLRFTFDLRLPPGTWLQIVGTKKYEPETGKVKLKAERVMAAGFIREIGIEPKSETDLIISRNPLITEESSNQKAEKKAVILMCQKSDCMKRGGNGLCKALEAQLSERNLDNVTIKATGCMKNCKGGPNLVMPDKTRYTRIQASEVPALLDKHFGVDNFRQAQKSNAAIPASC